jgi:hypothetical protein
MEDLNLFPLLNDVNGSSLGLEAAHVEDNALRDAVSNALNFDGKIATAEQLVAIKQSFDTYVSFHLNHFVVEEQLMMPLTQKVHPTHQGRSRAVHAHLVTPAMERSVEEFVFYISWCVNKLNMYGSTDNSSEVAVRVFVRALHSASSAAQWSLFKPVVKANCSEDIWITLQRTYFIDEPVGDGNLISDLCLVAGGCCS